LFVLKSDLRYGQKIVRKMWIFYYMLIHLLWISFLEWR